MFAVHAAEGAPAIPTNAVGVDGAVLATGGWTHTVPIELPPAPRGHVPTLAVVADHQVQDGPLGVGWRLEGFSRIERKSEHGGTPEFTSSDTYLMDGMRLHQVDSTLTTTTYRLEKDDNRVFVYDSAANRWEGQRDGWSWRYGEFSDGGSTWRGRCATEHLDEIAGSPCDASPSTGASKAGETTAWLLSRIREPANNDIFIEYTSGENLDTSEEVFGGDHAYVHLPTRVTYAQGYNQIRFVYAVRPDVRVDGHAALLRKMPLRLKALEVYGNANVTPTRHTRYRFDYVDEEAGDCAGQLADTGFAPDLSAESVLQSVVRVGSTGGERQVRCIETDRSETDFSVMSELPLEDDFTHTSNPALFSELRMPAVVNFDGDPWPDVAIIGFLCDLTWSNDCEVDHSAWTNPRAPLPFSGPHPQDTGLVTALEAAITDEFINCEGVYNFTDINRDGATDLVLAHGDYASCPDAAPAHSGVLYGVPGGTPDTVEASDFPFAAEDVKNAQFVDIDGDNFTDMVLPSPDVSTPTRWYKNSGVAPYFDLAAGVDTYIPLEDVWSDSRLELILLQEACDSPDGPVPLASGAAEVGYPPDEWEFITSHARWGDFNSDGVADVAYAMTTCWTLDSDNAWPIVDDIFSYIYYGDGTGEFADGPTGAGPAAFTVHNYSSSAPSAHISAVQTLGLVDLDRSGRADLVYSDSDGFDSLAWAHDIGLRNSFGFEGHVPDCAHAVCERGELPMDYLGDAYARQDYAFADWDADGFPDVLHFDTSGNPLTIEKASNLRTTSRHRITTIHDAWGGEIVPTYASSALVGDNDEMPYALEVIASVEAERGLISFDFSGGYTHDGRFTGYTTANIEYASGRTSTVKFAQAPGLNGDVVSQTEYRTDGTIETFTFFQFIQVITSGGAPAWRLDTTAPYFNPLNRRCDFWVGPGAGGGMGPLQSVDEEDLIQQCMSWQDHPDFWSDQWAVWLGWDRHPVGDETLQQHVLVVWNRDGEGDLVVGPWTGASDMWPPGPAAFPEREVYPPLDGEAPSEVATPDTPPTPPIVTGDPTTTIQMYVEDWGYDGNQRVVEDRNYHDASINGDDLYLTFNRAWDAGATGSRINWIKWWEYGAGAPVRTLFRTDFAHFDIPRELKEQGPSGPTREWHYTYSLGEVASQTDAESKVTTFTRNPCGLVLSRTDPMSRVETSNFNVSCRTTGWAWQGATKTFEYDEFGRLARTEVDADTSSTADTRQIDRWHYDDDIGVVDVRGTWAEPRSAKVSDNGVLELNYLDPWGRETLDVVCQLDGSGAGSSLTHSGGTLACGAGTETWNYRGWSTDGLLRAVSRPFAPGGDPAASTWTFRDVFDRVEEQLDPSPTSTPDTWVQTSYTWLPGETLVKGPTGRECATTFTTLESDLTCEGAFRGGTARDAFGNLVEAEDGLGNVTVIEYDRFRRPSARYVDAYVDVYPTGTATPRTEFEWTDTDRLKRQTDALNNVRSWTYDGAGRLTHARYKPASAFLPTLVNQWTYFNFTGAANSRYVVETDVNLAVTTTRLDGLERAREVQLPNGRQEKSTWDAKGRLATFEDEDGLVTSYTYTPTGSVASEVSAGATRTFDYTDSGHLESEVDRDGVETDHTWMWDGRHAWSGRTSGSDVWTFSEHEYYDDGLVRAAREGGVLTTYTYDPLGRLDSACEADASASCLVSHAWDWTAADQIESAKRWVESETPTVTDYTYDALGRKTRVDHPGGTSFEEWAYDELGQVRAYTDEEGDVSVWEYDEWNRVAFETLPEEGATREFQYTFGTTGTEEHLVIEPDLGEWRTWYDFAGRPVTEQWADGTGVARSYSGSRLTHLTYLDGTSPIADEHYEYDALGFLTQRWRPIDHADFLTRGTPATPIVGDYYFTYTNSLEGRVETLEGPNDLTTFTWRPDGYLDTEDIDGVTSITYGYDSDYPRVTEVVTGTATETRVVFRDWERGLYLAEETIDRLSGTSLVDTMGRTWSNWDAYGSPRSIASTRNSAADTSYSLTTDARGRSDAVSVSTGGTSVGTIDYDWYDDGELASLKFQRASAGWDGVNYDRSGPGGTLAELTRVAGGATLATIAARDAAGRAAEIDLGGGGHIERVYDQMARLESLYVETTTPAAWQSRSYTYDARGRLASLALDDGTTVRTEAMHYAEPGWLTNEDRDSTGMSPDSYVYTYDEAGNRTGTTLNATSILAASYDPGNMLAVANATTVLWDEFGGIIEDHRGTLIDRAPDGSEDTVSDSLGTLVDILHRDAEGLPVQFDDGTAVQDIVWGHPEGTWPVFGTDENGDSVVWVAADGLLLGQIRDGVPMDVATDESGSIVLHDSDFLALPGAWGDAASAHAVGTATEKYVYAGLQSLPGTPLQLARHRLYDPELGRFTSIDPLGLSGGDHRFAYANGDPLAYIDPAGLFGIPTTSGGVMEDPGTSTGWDASRTLNVVSTTTTGGPTPPSTPPPQGGGEDGKSGKDKPKKGDKPKNGGEDGSGANRKKSEENRKRDASQKDVNPDPPTAADPSSEPEPELGEPGAPSPSVPPTEPAPTGPDQPEGPDSAPAQPRSSPRAPGPAGGSSGDDVVQALQRMDHDRTVREVRQGKGERSAGGEGARGPVVVNGPSQAPDTDRAFLTLAPPIAGGAAGAAVLAVIIVALAGCLMTQGCDEPIYWPGAQAPWAQHSPVTDGEAGAPPITASPESAGVYEASEGAAKVLQRGGNTIDKGTARALNEQFGTSAERREWGRALESIKKENGLSPNDHGTITEAATTSTVRGT